MLHQFQINNTVIQISKRCGAPQHHRSSVTWPHGTPWPHPTTPLCGACCFRDLLLPLLHPSCLSPFPPAASPPNSRQLWTARSAMCGRREGEGSRKQWRTGKTGACADTRTARITARSQVLRDASSK